MFDMTVLVMLLLGVNSAISIGANIGDDRVGNAPAGSSAHGS